MQRLVVGFVGVAGVAAVAAAERIDLYVYENEDGADVSVIDVAQVSLETRNAASPGVLRPVGGTDFVHIIMPMHIAS